MANDGPRLAGMQGWLFGLGAAGVGVVLAIALTTRPDTGPSISDRAAKVPSSDPGPMGSAEMLPPAQPHEIASAAEGADEVEPDGPGPGVDLDAGEPQGGALNPAAARVAARRDSPDS